MRNPGLEQLDNFQTAVFLEKVIIHQIKNGTSEFTINNDNKEYLYSYIENNDTVIVLTLFSADSIASVKNRFPGKNIGYVRKIL